MTCFRYTEEEHKWLHENIPGHTHKETAEAFSRLFRPLTDKQVNAYCKQKHVYTGNTGRFVKGQTCPWKGLKQSEFLSPDAIERTKVSRFKKGMKPHNTVPVGTERNNIGYIEVKVAEPNVWVLKHRLIWEQAYGPIPENHYVRFKDGNPMNLSLDNLFLIDRETHMSMTRLGIQKPPPEMFETAALIGKLDSETWKKRRNKNDNQRA